MNKKLLIDEGAIVVVVLPTLERVFGLYEAMFMQQLHYLSNIGSMGKEVDGRRWIRNTIPEWLANFYPVIRTARTIERAIGRLEARKVVLSRHDLNVTGYDRTKWYAIDYDAMEKAIVGHDTPSEGVIETVASMATIPNNTSYNIKDKEASPKKTVTQHGVSEEEKEEPPTPTTIGEEKPPVVDILPKGHYANLLTEELNALDGSQDQVRRCLEYYFRSRTGLRPPVTNKSAAALWWVPLREIAVLSEWDVRLAIDLMEEAIRRLVKGATIKSPMSLLNTVKTAALDRQLALDATKKEAETGAKGWTPGGYGTVTAETEAENRWRRG